MNNMQQKRLKEFQEYVGKHSVHILEEELPGGLLIAVANEPWGDHNIHYQAIITIEGVLVIFTTEALIRDFDYEIFEIDEEIR